LNKSAKTIVIRTKGGMSYGWGHVIRSRTLARHLKESGRYAHVIVVAESDKYLRGRLETYKLNYLFVSDSKDEAISLEEVEFLQGVNVDLVVFDMLRVPDSLLEAYRLYGSKIVIFNDMADKDYSVDMMIYPQNQELDPSYSSSRHYLVGADYFIINPVLFSVPNSRVHSKNKRNKFLVYAGGSVTKRVYDFLLELLISLPALGLEITFLKGFDNEIDEHALRKRSVNEVNFVEGSENLSALFLNTDFALAASGYIKYELAYCGIPSLLFSIVDHQRLLGEAYCRNSGSCVYVGDIKDINIEDVEYQIRKLSTDFEYYQNVSYRAVKFIDGQGVYRIAKELGNLTL